MPDDKKKQNMEEDSVMKDQENYQGEKGGQTQANDIEDVSVEDADVITSEDIVNDEE